MKVGVLLRIFAISDLHVDFDENRCWVNNLSKNDYQDDVLIVAGDVSDMIKPIMATFAHLKLCFAEVLYIPGNHDLWVTRCGNINSLDKFELLQNIVSDEGIHMKPLQLDSLSIIPLLSWYDYSFGQPSDDLIVKWADYTACDWPEGYDESQVTDYFLALNKDYVSHKNMENEMIISFSHFLPRIDVMPAFIPQSRRKLYPVLGTSRLDKQIRELGSKIHVYGHSHVNQGITLNGTLYVNNAFGYPYETSITSKELLCIYDQNI